MERRTLLSALGTITLATITGCSELEDSLGGVTEPSEEEVKQNAERIAYEELYRNISDYEGEYVYYNDVHITDIASGEGTKEYLFMFNGGGFTDDRVLYGVWEGDPFREQDRVELWGVVQGLTTYQSLGGKRSVPKIRIHEMNLVS